MLLKAFKRFKNKPFSGAAFRVVTEFKMILKVVENLFSDVNVVLDNRNTFCTKLGPSLRVNDMK